MEPSRITLLMVAFLSGLLLIGPPYWLLPYREAEPPAAFLGPFLLAPALIAALLVMVRAARMRRVIGMMAACMPTAIALRVLVEALRDPTAHNLWPFELVVGAVLGLVAVLPGIVLGLLLRRVWEAG